MEALDRNRRARLVGALTAASALALVVGVPLFGLTQAVTMWVGVALVAFVLAEGTAQVMAR